MNVFIIGAGFTKAVFSEAPLNGCLLDALITKSRNSVALVLIDRYKTHDIEIALTRLDMDIQSPLDNPEFSPDDDLRKLRQSIETELVHYFSAYCMSEAIMADSPWLTQFVDGAIKSGDAAISLNYDCALEGALDCRHKWTPNHGYGFLSNPLAKLNNPPETPVQVLKIHGSVSFVQTQTRCREDRQRRDENESGVLSFLFDESFFPRSARNKHFGGGVGGTPYLIAPSYVKEPTVQIACLMIESLCATAEAQNLVIIGTSLRSEDTFLKVLVTNFLRQRNWQERRIVVVDPDASRITASLKRYWAVDVAKQIVPVDGRLQDSVSRLFGVLAQ
jgi:hypothetical protein